VKSTATVWQVDLSLGPVQKRGGRWLAKVVGIGVGKDGLIRSDTIAIKGRYKTPYDAMSRCSEEIRRRTQ